MINDARFHTLDLLKWLLSLSRHIVFLFCCNFFVHMATHCVLFFVEFIRSFSHPPVIKQIPDDWGPNDATSLPG